MRDVVPNVSSSRRRARHRRARSKVNYFLGALGELVQRMGDPAASYGLALPDHRQYRGLVEQLPSLARERSHLRIWFVRADGAVSEDDSRKGSYGRMTVADWIRLLNRRVYLFAESSGRDTLTRKYAARHGPQEIITLEPMRLLALAGDRAELADQNTRSDRPCQPPPTSRGTPSSLSTSS